MRIWLSTTNRTSLHAEMSFFLQQIRISECFCGATVRLWCVNELKNGLQQCSVIPAEPNLGEGVQGWQFGGCWGVSVCAQALQNKPINIPGSLGSCSSKLKLTACSVYATESTHRYIYEHLLESVGAFYQFIFSVISISSPTLHCPAENVSFFWSDIKLLFLPNSNSLILCLSRNVWLLLEPFPAITATHVKSFKG